VDPLSQPASFEFAILLNEMQKNERIAPEKFAKNEGRLGIGCEQKVD
jgi:hypothetical protein